MNVLLIDNYDSFVHNLYHQLAGLEGVKVTVLRNDNQDLLSRIEAGEFDKIVVGPGPGSPDDRDYFGKNLDIIRRYGQEGLPIFGVCLGFQGIAYEFGAKLKKADIPIHGKYSPLSISNQPGVLTGLPQGVEVMRYHSLMIDPDHPLPDELRILAEVQPSEDTVSTNGREIMAIAHTTLPIAGVQFHPESHYTRCGTKIMKNFITG